jgi:membrane-associated PAP2 superfamily phosphatase
MKGSVPYLKTAIEFNFLQIYALLTKQYLFTEILNTLMIDDYKCSNYHYSFLKEEWTEFKICF